MRMTRDTLEKPIMLEKWKDLGRKWMKWLNGIYEVTSMKMKLNEIVKNRKKTGKTTFIHDITRSQCRLDGTWCWSYGYSGQAKNIWTPEFQLFDFKATPNFYNTTDTNIKTMSGQVHIYIARKCTTASRIFKGRSTVLIKL